MESIQKARKLFTLVLVNNSVGEILLGFKKRGFGKNLWNGFGGKIEKGETIWDAARRELTEECGLVANSLTSVGLMEFRFIKDPVIFEMYIFKTDDYSGEVVESDEMRPQWFSVNDIPFSVMWSDTKIWFPWYRRGEHFKGCTVHESLEEDSLIESYMEKSGVADKKFFNN